MVDATEISHRRKLSALVRVAKFRTGYTLGIIGGGIFAALLEGIGIGFILPIIEIVQASGNPAENSSGFVRVFVSVYEYLDVPFTLGSVVAGVSLVLTTRWTLTFAVRWLRDALSVRYTRELQKQAFGSALETEIEYFDQKGSDDILNAIVTQAEYAGRVIRFVINFVERGLLAVMYLSVAFVISPELTLFTLVFLGGFTVLFRYVIEPGYELGDEVAKANERVQQAVQAGTQGIRDTKLFGLKQELFEDFLDAVNQFARASVRQKRNQQAIQSFYNLMTAVSIFVLIYLAIEFADMSLGSLSVFLFAMFRLGPKASNLNASFYRIENNLPHLVRTQNFIDELDQHREDTESAEPVPDEVRRVTFEDVYFTYPGQQDPALSGISFQVESGEFVGFVGHSGAGKSTIISMLARMYEPEDGEIRANGEPIHRMDIDDWRDRISVVSQDPFIFNESLRYNLTIGNRGVSREELDRVCRIAKVDEFFDDLSDGYETQLGDNGVRLSGGQKQRVALARALLKDADVLVLDEATSNLDSNLERQVQSAIESMDREYAVVGIAHRLSTVKSADRIYTVDDGRIIETGTHNELLDEEGRYAELYALQSKPQ